MKITVLGAHGVGKSTISQILAEELGLPILNDVVREAFDLGFEINETTPIETQIWMTGKQIENEKINSDYIADKCIYDYYVYAGALGMDEDVVKTIYKLAKKTADYDVIFYIQPEFPIPDDGIRSLNEDFQSNINTFYKDFLDKENIKYTLLTGSVEDRKQQAMDKINSMR